MPQPKHNKPIVQLRKLNPKHYTFSVLGDIFGMSKQGAKWIWDRYKDEYDLPEWVEVDKSRYPEPKVNQFDD